MNNQKKTTAKILKTSYQNKFLTKKNNGTDRIKTISDYYTLNIKSAIEHPISFFYVKKEDVLSLLISLCIASGLNTPCLLHATSVETNIYPKSFIRTSFISLCFAFSLYLTVPEEKIILPETTPPYGGRL